MSVGGKGQGHSIQIVCSFEFTHRVRRFWLSFLSKPTIYTPHKRNTGPSLAVDKHDDTIRPAAILVCCWH